MEPNVDFVRRLKAFDKWLDVEFHEGRQRWRIVKSVEAPGRNGHRGNIPPHITVPAARYKGKKIMRMKPNRWTIMWLTDKDGGYAEPGQEVIDILRAGDMWKKDYSTADKIEERDAYRELKADIELGDNTDDITQTALDMRRRIQFDLGSTRTGRANATE